MTNNNDLNANTLPGADEKKAITDPRLKPIVKLIETQLMPVKEVLADYAQKRNRNSPPVSGNQRSLNSSSLLA